MKRKILTILLVLALPLVLWAGVRWDYNTSGEYSLLDSDGNTMYKIVDDGTTGEIEMGELDISGNIDIDGTSNLDIVDIDGAVNNAGAVTQTGDVDISANLTQDGLLIREASSVVNIGTSTELSITDSFMVIIGSDTTSGAQQYISDATPFISTTSVTAGTEVLIMGTDDTGYVTISDDSQVSGSQLELDGNTMDLKEDHTITLMYYDEKWVEISRSVED